jgi:pimeloyl-ACP methyl ester carboxylesterase
VDRPYIRGLILVVCWARLGRSRGHRPIRIYGHSWGTLVAVALALEFPSLVQRLILASGYYYPTVRADVFLLSPPAIPVIGDAMRYTISPLVARAMLPGMLKRMFQPAAVPEQFDRLFPLTIITGGDDQISDVGRQSQRLHRELPKSKFIMFRGLGHMIHHLAPDAVAGRSRARFRGRGEQM